LVDPLFIDVATLRGNDAKRRPVLRLNLNRNVSAFLFGELGCTPEW
jgi:hypothetical protein